jgi:6-phosphogluconolactonase (cycloisomerase 2 family)
MDKVELKREGFMFNFSKTRRFLLTYLSLVLPIASTPMGSALAQERVGAVYVNTNQATGNMIAAYARATNGALTLLGDFSTGGNGAGSGIDPLASQGALALTSDGVFLFAVNAGSNTIAAMRVTKTGLQFLGKIVSGGTKPTSLTIHKNLLYVLNAGGTPNITGYTIQTNGSLTFVSHSQQSLPGGTAALPTQISFSPDGSFLVVPERGDNNFDVFPVQSTGVTSSPVVSSSIGKAPFGFGFTLNGTMVVSEAGVSGTVSSYIIAPSGNLIPVSRSIPDTQSTPCWVAIPDPGNVAFVVNNGSASISSLDIASDGTLTLANGIAGSTGSSSSPIDEALSAYNQFLYVIDPPNGSISAFSVGSDGSLTSIPGVTGLPPSSQGIVAQ